MNSLEEKLERLKNLIAIASELGLDTRILKEEVKIILERMAIEQNNFK